MPTVDKISRLYDEKSSWGANPLIHGLRVYINFIQFLFREGNPTGLIYRHDAKNTDISIMSGGRVDSELVSVRPAIAVNRDAARLKCMTIASVSDRSISTGDITRKEQLPFSIVANIVSNNDIQVEEIAWYVASRTWLHMDILSQAGFFSMGQDISITAPGAATGVVDGDVGGYFLVRLIMPVQTLVTYSISHINLEKLNKIWLSVQNGTTEEQISQVKIEQT